MIKFNNILESKQVGVLYHFTSIIHCLKILNSNYMKSFRDGAISFTRNKDFLSVKRDTIPHAIMFVIDGNKLSNRYKIQPISDDPILFGDEQEEIVITKIGIIENIHQYVIKIILIRNEIKNQLTHYNQNEFSYFNKTLLDNGLFININKINIDKFIYELKKFIENKGYKVEIK